MALNAVIEAARDGEAINLIKEKSAHVLRTVGDIASALAEQSTASNDIAAHIEKVAQMTEENSRRHEGNRRRLRQPRAAVGYHTQRGQPVQVLNAGSRALAGNLKDSTCDDNWPT